MEKNAPPSFLFTVIVYLFGFITTDLVILSSNGCGYVSYKNVFGAIAGILVMALIILYTYDFLKKRPDLRVPTWGLGSILILFGGFFIFATFSVFCPNMGLPPPGYSQLSALYAIVAGIVALMQLGYIFGFGVIAARGKHSKLFWPILIAIVLVIIAFIFFSLGVF